MPGFTISEQIRAPREEVFDRLRDFASAAQTYSAISKIEMLTDGEVRAGTRFRETRVMFGKEATEEMEVAEYERPSRIVLTAASCGCHYTSTYRLEAQGDGTELQLAFEGRGASFIGKVMSALMGPLMAKACRKACARDLAELKAVLEG